MKEGSQEGRKEGRKGEGEGGREEKGEEGREENARHNPNIDRARNLQKREIAVKINDSSPSTPKH
jgi:hypothetical protein